MAGAGRVRKSGSCMACTSMVFTETFFVFYRCRSDVDVSPPGKYVHTLVWTYNTTRIVVVRRRWPARGGI